MRKILRKILGVTLLEVMLVLAIAAMIIVMSIRYYQSASANQQANTFISQMQAIVAAAESVATSSGSYADVTDAKLQPLLPANALNAPWGGTLGVKGTSSNITITPSAAPADNVCAVVTAKIDAAGTFDYTGKCATFTYPKKPAA